MQTYIKAWELKPTGVAIDIIKGWELKPTRVAIEIEERAVLSSKTMELTEQKMKNSMTEDRGACVGEGGGYSVIEQRRLEIIRNLRKVIFFC